MDDRLYFRIAKALSDPKRFELLTKIACHQCAPTCTAMVDEIGLSKATVSHHISELADAGLIEVRREAKFAYLEPNREAINAYLSETARRLKLQ